MAVGERTTVSARGRRGSFLGHAVTAAGMHLLLPITSLATGPVLARVLGPQGRGEMTAVLAPMFVTVLIGATAVPEATTYAVAKLGYPARRVVKVSACLLLAYGALAGLGLAVAAPWLLRSSPQVVPLLRTTAFFVPAMMIATMLRHAALGGRRFRLAHVERAAAPLSRLALVLLLAGIGQLTVTNAVATNMATTILASFVIIIPLVGGRCDRDGVTPNGNNVDPGGALVPLGRQVAAYGFAGWAGVLGHAVNYRIDQALLAIWVGAAQIGFYTVAFSVAQLPFMAFAAVRPVLFAEASHRDDMALVARAARCTVPVVLLMVVAGLALTPSLLIALFGGEFREAVPLAQVLLLGVVPFACEQILAAGLLSRGKPGLRSVGQIAAAVVTLVGLAVLVPIMGVLGAALTSLAAYLLNYLITLAMFVRETGLAVREVTVVTTDDVRWISRRLALVARGGRRHSKHP